MKAIIHFIQFKLSLFIKFIHLFEDLFNIQMETNPLDLLSNLSYEWMKLTGNLFFILQDHISNHVAFYILVLPIPNKF